MTGGSGNGYIHEGMICWTRSVEISTRGRGFYPLDSTLSRAVSDSGIESGLLHAFIRHTSASLLVTENADPDVLRDLEMYMGRLVQDGDPAFSHRAEGPDDMAAHVRSVLTRTELSLPIRKHRLQLGTWQGVFLWEHRFDAHQRRVELTLLGGT